MRCSTHFLSTVPPIYNPCRNMPDCVYVCAMIIISQSAVLTLPLHCYNRGTQPSLTESASRKIMIYPVIFKWEGIFNQITFSSIQNLYELLLRGATRHRTAPIQFDREHCFVVLRCYACEWCLRCVRVSVSFTSTVNYVGIHIAQHFKVCSTVDKEENVWTWPKAVKRRTQTERQVSHYDMTWNFWHNKDLNFHIETTSNFGFDSPKHLKLFKNRWNFF